MDTLKQVLSAGKALVENIKSGKLYAEPEEVNRRLAICGVCPFNINDKCEKCGCRIEMKTKANISSCGDKDNPRW